MVKSAGADASQDTFENAAAFSEIIFNCTGGMVSLEALKLAGKDNLGGKILIDVANPLDFQRHAAIAFRLQYGFLGEQIQREFRV